MDEVNCRSCEEPITVMSLPCGEILRLDCPHCGVPLEVVWSAREVAVTIGQGVDKTHEALCRVGTPETM